MSRAPVALAPGAPSIAGCRLACGSRCFLEATRKELLLSSVITSTPIKHQRPGTSEDDVLRDYRERRVIEALEREAAKRQDHAEQCSTENSAGMRIRAWEKVHQLRMPSTPSHPVLPLIALATQLSLAEVQDEQQLRIARSASADV